MGIWKPDLIFVCHSYRLLGWFLGMLPLSCLPKSESQRQLDFLLCGCTMWFGIRMLKTKECRKPSCVLLVFHRVLQLIDRKWKRADALSFSCITSKKGSLVEWPCLGVWRLQRAWCHQYEIIRFVLNCSAKRLLALGICNLHIARLFV